MYFIPFFVFVLSACSLFTVPINMSTNLEGFGTAINPGQMHVIQKNTWSFKLFIKSVGERDFGGVSPLALARDRTLAGMVDCIIPLKNGTLLVKPKSAETLNQIRNLAPLVICKYKCKTFLPEECTTVEGVMHIHPRENIDDWLDHLEVVGANKAPILNASRIFNRFHKATGIVKLIFQGEKLPNLIKIKNSDVYIPVEIYQVQPLRCYKCQSFGHTAPKCKNEVKCARCAGDHVRGACEYPIRCPNCTGTHTARYRLCPEYTNASKIQTFKNKNGCSWTRAVESCRQLQSQSGNGCPNLKSHRGVSTRPAASWEETQVNITPPASPVSPIRSNPVPTQATTKTTQVKPPPVSAIHSLSCSQITPIKITPTKKRISPTRSTPVSTQVTTKKTQVKPPTVSPIHPRSYSQITPNKVTPTKKRAKSPRPTCAISLNTTPASTSMPVNTPKSANTPSTLPSFPLGPSPASSCSWSSQCTTPYSPSTTSKDNWDKIETNNILRKTPTYNKGESSLTDVSQMESSVDSSLHMPTKQTKKANKQNINKSFCTQNTQTDAVSDSITLDCGNHEQKITLTELSTIILNLLRVKINGENTNKIKEFINKILRPKQQIPTTKSSHAAKKATRPPGTHPTQKAYTHSITHLLPLAATNTRVSQIGTLIHGPRLKNLTSPLKTVSGRKRLNMGTPSKNRGSKMMAYK